MEIWQWKDSAGSIRTGYILNTGVLFLKQYALTKTGARVFQHLKRTQRFLAPRGSKWETTDWEVGPGWDPSKLEHFIQIRKSRLINS